MISSGEQAISQIMQWINSGTVLDLDFTGLGIRMKVSDVHLRPFEALNKGLVLETGSGDFSASLKLADFTPELVEESPLVPRPCVKLAFAAGFSMRLCEA